MNTIVRFALSAAFLCTPALAGDVERPCQFNQPTANFPERLSTGTLSWSLVVSPGATGSFAPGFPINGCLGGAPVLQSIAGAMTAWNTATLSSGFGMPSLTLPTNYLSKVDVGNPLAVVNATNGTSIVSMWEPAANWAALGGATVLAVARVRTVGSPVPSSIVECDIALNTLSTDPNGVAMWSFVETVGSLTLGTWPPTGAPRGDPVLGYADMQGVLTHEVGHLIGMGHSLVDSSMMGAANETPTMFETAQAEPFGPGSIADPNTTCTTGSWGSVAIVSGSSLFGGSARTLEPDDASATLRAYPATVVGGGAGTLTGTIRIESSGPCSNNPPNYPALGVSVVAIAANDPNGTRIGTLSLAFASTPCPGLPIGTNGWNAAYTLSALPPGNYFIEAQIVRTPYFSFGGLPEYITSLGCQPAPAAGVGATVPEFFGSGDGFSEAISMGSGIFRRTTQTASQVTVTAGTVVSGLDMRIETLPNLVNQLMPIRRLFVGTVPTAGSTMTNGSERGFIVPRSDAAAAASTIARYQIDNLPAGTTVVLCLDLVRNLTLDPSSQVRQVSPFIALSTTVPASPAFGSARFDVPIVTGLGYLNFFGQAFVQEPGLSTPIVTNVANIWFVEP